MRGRESEDDLLHARDLEPGHLSWEALGGSEVGSLDPESLQTVRYSQRGEGVGGGGSGRGRGLQLSHSPCVSLLGGTADHSGTYTHHWPCSTWRGVWLVGVVSRHKACLPGDGIGHCLPFKLLLVLRNGLHTPHLKDWSHWAKEISTSQAPGTIVLMEAIIIGLIEEDTHCRGVLDIVLWRFSALQQLQRNTHTHTMTTGACGLHGDVPQQWSIHQ